MRTFLQRAFLGLFLLSLPALSFAATCTPDPATGLQCPLDETSFSGPEFITGLINKVSNWLFTFLLVLAVTFIVIAAYKYLFSGGSEESVSAAHKMMLYAAVAVAVALLSRGFVVVVRSLVGASAGPSTSGGSTTPGTTGTTTNPLPVNYRIVDNSNNTVTLAVLPATSISIYNCTLPDGSKWTPAYRFIGVPNVTNLQGGCRDSCTTHEARYGGFESYQIATGVQLEMEKCADGTSPRFIFNGQSFGGTDGGGTPTSFTPTTPSSATAANTGAYASVGPLDSGYSVQTCSDGEIPGIIVDNVKYGNNANIQASTAHPTAGFFKSLTFSGTPSVSVQICNDGTSGHVKINGVTY